jgi:hypothetical protein
MIADSQQNMAKMFTARRVQLLVIALPALLATSLSAQRYPVQDHHVFHRPTPPAMSQVKHQQSGNSGTTRTNPSSTNSTQNGSTAHTNDGSHHGDLTLNPSSNEPRSPK